MAFSNGDAKKEIAEIISGIGSDERAISSAKDALKIVAIYPVMMVLSLILLWFSYYSEMVFLDDNSGQNLYFFIEAANLVMGYGGWISIGVTSIIAIFFILLNYSTAMVYLSIPEDVRHRSRIINSIKSTVKKISLILWGGAITLSVIGLISHWIILLAVSIPVVLFISIFIINGYLGVQSARYGLGALMSAANKTINR